MKAIEKKLREINSQMKDFSTKIAPKKIGQNNLSNISGTRALTRPPQSSR